MLYNKTIKIEGQAHSFETIHCSKGHRNEKFCLFQNLIENINESARIDANTEMWFSMFNVSYNIYKQINMFQIYLENIIHVSKQNSF